MSFDSIYNHYEQLVFNRIMDTVGRQTPPPDEDYLADLACVALNHLPPRYVRYPVTVAYYLSPTERLEIDQKVAAAVEQAVRFVAMQKTEP